MFSVPYLPSFFYVPYILFMYKLINLTQINELTYDCSLFILPIIEFNHLSMFIKYFHFYKTRVIFCLIFSFLKWKILIIFNAEEITWPFERLEHYLERETHGMLKSFNKT